MGEDILEKYCSEARRHDTMWCIWKMSGTKDGGRIDWQGDGLEEHLV